ncbi:hypothetical protein ABPG73_006691 [Tetrahymena malaccensis]
MDESLDDEWTSQAKQVKNIFEQYLKDNQQIIDSSLNKRIVCTIGLTGSGKSTLLNFLCGKDLIIKDEGGFLKTALLNPNDPTCFKIGEGCHSFTILPQFTVHNGIQFYDFAGLNDTRGVEYSLLNACFIKQIVEKASNVIFLFVVEQATIDSNRGQDFLELINKFFKLLPQIQNQPNLNALVITKATQQNQEEFNSYLNNPNTPLKNLDQMIRLRKFKISEPNNENRLCEEDRNKILDFIQSNHGNVQSQIDIESIYSTKESNLIESLYKEELQSISHKLNPQKDYLNMKIQELQNEIQITNNLNIAFQQAIQQSQLIYLLKTISQKTFDTMMQMSNKAIQDLQIAKVEKLENHISRIQRGEQINNLMQQQNNINNQINQLQQSIASMRRRRRCNIF